MNQKEISDQEITRASPSAIFLSLISSAGKDLRRDKREKERERERS